MTAPKLDRLPFDEEDTRLANAYLASTGRTSFDPFGPGEPGTDQIMTTSLADARLMMAESFDNKDAAGRAFRVLPVFVAQPSPDAFAVKRDGLHICGLNTGLASTVYELALFVFSQGSMFEDIGNAAGERSPRLPPGAMLSYWISDRLRAGEGAEGRSVGAELIPRDLQRQAAALFLTLLMLRFVWVHELFHCLNGHTGYTAKWNREAALHEMSDDTVLALIEVETRAATTSLVNDGYCMEFDADRSAFWVMMKRQAAGYEPIDGLRALPTMLRLRLTMFAAVLLTFLFDQAARRRRRQMSASHPIAVDRLHNLVRTMASNLADPAGEMKQVFAYTVVEMDEFQSCLPYAMSGLQLVQDLRSKESQRAFDAMESKCRLARTRVAPYSFQQ